MEHLLPFNFRTTRYRVFRQQEWLLFVSVEPADGGRVNLDVDVVLTAYAGVATPRRYPLAPDEGVRLQVERPDGTTEIVTIWLEKAGKKKVVLGFELPDGVRMEPLDR